MTSLVLKYYSREDEGKQSLLEIELRKAMEYEREYQLSKQTTRFFLRFRVLVSKLFSGKRKVIRAGWKDLIDVKMQNPFYHMSRKSSKL